MCCVLVSDKALFGYPQVIVSCGVFSSLCDKGKTEAQYIVHSPLFFRTIVGIERLPRTGGLLGFPKRSLTVAFELDHLTNVGLRTRGGCSRQCFNEKSKYCS